MFLIVAKKSKTPPFLWTGVISKKNKQNEKCWIFRSKYTILHYISKRKQWTIFRICISFHIHKQVIAWVEGGNRAVIGDGVMQAAGLSRAA